MGVVYHSGMDDCISTKNIEKHIITENIPNLDRWGRGSWAGLKKKR